MDAYCTCTSSITLSFFPSPSHLPSLPPSLPSFLPSLFPSLPPSLSVRTERQAMEEVRPMALERTNSMRIKRSEVTMIIHTWHIQSDIENCEGWLSPGGHGSGGRALTAKVRGPRFNPGWLPVFHGSQKIFPSLFSCKY